RKPEFPVELPDPPIEMVQSIASGRSVLWAGAGLSAQSGFPTRNAFIATVLQAASVDEWVPGARVQRFATMVSRGEGEAALSELVTAASAVRGHLIAHYKSI